MPSTSGPLPVASIFHSLAAAPRDGHGRYEAARQLAGLDPKRFLSNLQVAAMSRSPQAISALAADMRELEDIFHKLARAGHDVSAAQRDYQVLKQFISQLTYTSNRDQQQQSRPAQPNQSHHHRSNSFPPPSSRHHHEVVPPHPLHQPHLQSGSGSVSHQYYKPSSSSSPSSKAQYNPRSSHLPPQGFAQGGLASTSSLRSSSSSSRSSSQSSHYSQAPSPLADAVVPEILSPVPNRLVKPRRMSAPAVASASAAKEAKEVKRVHFARHATVYMFSTDVKGTYRITNNETNAPARPSCVPRVDGSHTSESRPRF